MNREAIPDAEAEKYFFHFPDGNASIARLIVRSLLPEAIPGNSVTDVVTAKANYGRLDQASSPIRIRLNSTVVRVKHDGDPHKSTTLNGIIRGAVVSGRWPVVRRSVIAR